MADEEDLPTHAGIAVFALDTGRVLMQQRALDGTDAPDVAGTWEFPGGSIEEGETAEAGAWREFSEETGLPTPDGETVNGWRKGPFQGFVFQVPVEGEAFSELNPDLDAAELVNPDDKKRTNPDITAWFTIEQAQNLGPALRPELSDMDWALFSVETEGAEMANEEIEVETEEVEEDAPMFARIPGHGVLIAEDTRSGDGRLFNSGSLTMRNLPLILDWQKVSAPGHDNATPVFSIQKVARIGDEIHFSGLFLSTAEADDFIGVLQEVEYYGISIDAVDGAAEYDEETDTVRYSQGRIAGATAVKVQAIGEAWLRLGTHPILDADEIDETVTAVAMAPSNHAAERELALTAGRGPGWITDPVPTKRIHDYWTKPGQEGYEKINWGVPGDFNRCRVQVGAKIAENSPEDLRFLNQICAQWHHDAVGYWPGQEDTHASFEGELKPFVLTASVATIPSLVDMEVPHAYFENPKFAALTPQTIGLPDENGFRHVYGHIAEWGECHLGYLSQHGICVTPPESKSEYSYFLLGNMKTDKGNIRVGALTCGTGHASEFATWREAMGWYDNTGNTWGFVNVGQDEFGIWMSGIVNPAATDEMLFTVQSIGQVSGDWRPLQYGDDEQEMIGVLSVNGPGFPKLRASAGIVDGKQVSLVAAGLVAARGTTEDSVEELAIEVEKRLAAREAKRQKMKALKEKVG